MVFSSILFIFKFLPLALGIYYITPKRYKNLSLFILSMIFYSWGEPQAFYIIMLSTMLDYFISLGIDNNTDSRLKKNLLLITSLTVNIGLLIFFKYASFIPTFKQLQIPLPLGITFYTFQTLSYTIEVYRGNIRAERNIINLGAYIALFPQLIAGPIVKYIDVKDELHNRDITLDKIDLGIRYFIIGLGKKVLIANNIGMLWNEIETIGFENISFILAWMGIIAFSLQIYFDFSGYSNMAKGLGLLLGFTFPENFNYPYISRSISEFWRRWHITLGSWFKEYVYIPLGGNRRHVVLNLFIVWVLTGLWHGAEYNFIIWGLYFFTLVLIEKKYISRFLEKHKIISHLYTIVALVIGWAIFNISDLNSLYVFISKLFNVTSTIYNRDYIYYFMNYGVIFIIAILLSTPLFSNKLNLLKSNGRLCIMILVLILLLSISYLVDSSYNPFLYFRF